MRRRAGVSGLLLLPSIAACGGGDQPTSGPEPSRPAAVSGSSTRVAADAGVTPLGAAAPLAPRPLARFAEVLGEELWAREPTARVSLGRWATEPLRVEDPATGVAIEARLEGASAVGAARDGEARVFREVRPGADLVRLPTASGAEELVRLDTLPPEGRLRFRVTLGGHAAGLRHVGGVLEVLDRSGAPRLRVPRPWVAWREGGQPRRAEARLELEGCEADTRPAPPWGRPVVSPGATECGVTIAWDPAIARAPLIVDPLWELTGEMAFPRSGHTATALSYEARFLVVGGAAAAGTPAELFDAETSSWAVTGTPAEERAGHAAIAVDQGTVALIGGEVAGALTATTETYASGTGQFTAQGTLSAPRAGAVAVRPFQNAWIWVFGGRGASGPLATVERADRAATWTLDTPMTQPRDGHSVLPFDSVFGAETLVIAGGRGAAGVTNTTERYTTSYGAPGIAAAAEPLAEARASHAGYVANVIVGGFSEELLYVIGGEGAAGPLASIEWFDAKAAAWVPATASLSQPRTAFPSAVHQSGWSWFPVLGGTGTGGVLPDVVDVLTFTGFEVSVTSAGRLRTARAGAVAFPYRPVASSSLHRPVIAGGRDASNTPLATVERLTIRKAGACASFTSDCSSDTECASGPCLAGRCCNAFSPGQACEGDHECPVEDGARCVDGFCCNAACDGQCEACDVAGRIGFCAPVTGAPRGPRAACAGGGEPTCGSACDGVDPQACHAAPYGTRCGADVCDGDALRPTVCSGDGTCIAAREADPCAPYGCSSDACRTSCATAADCAQGFACTEGGDCRTTALPSCNGFYELLYADGTLAADCRPFACPSGATACPTACATDDDCHESVCAPDGTCRGIVGKKSKGCAASPAPASGGASLAALLGAALLLSRGRARRRA
ncbi:MAG: hypothetical protein IT376_02105 [Polyangiaceae bacterium]|nr:hypothetical protein [Polyangiaceae bacterium]